MRGAGDGWIEDSTPEEKTRVEDIRWTDGRGDYGFADDGQGNRAALRDAQKCQCVACGRRGILPNGAFAVMVTTVVDFPDESPPPGPSNPVMLIHSLCRKCWPLLKTPERLKRLLAPYLQPVSRAFGANTIVGQPRRDGSVANRLLEPVVSVAQPITPPTWFEGRAALVSKFYRNLPELKKYCDTMERVGLRAVGSFSSDTDRAAVYHFGMMFAQETDPFIGPPNVFLDPRMIGGKRLSYLVMDHESRNYVGAVAFDLEGYNTLAWAWLLPNFRRRGILSCYWPRFESSHSNFKILTPLSPGMKSFLSRHGGHELTDLTGPGEEE